MKTIVQPVRLSTVNGEESRLVKTAACSPSGAFVPWSMPPRKFPASSTQAASDVREAWEESNTSPKL